MPIAEQHREWIEARGIDPALAEAFGLQTVRRPDGNWLAVPYMHRGETLNHKYRLTTRKDHRMDPGAPLSLWNADMLSQEAVLNGSAPVVITEGEWDAFAAIEAGYRYVVSVPNGAPSTVTADLDRAARYEWADRHAAELAAVREFVLATDDDAAGHNLRTDLIALLGASRCRFVTYPAGCKDLGDVLLAHGPGEVVHRLATARPVPVQGLYTLDDFPERGPIRAYSVGIPAIDELISIVPGKLTVVTGYANMGKSTMMYAIIAHALAHHFPVCVASFETDVKPTLRDGLRAALLKCGRHELANRDCSAADAILRDRLSIISQEVDEDAEFDLPGFLDLCEAAVRRHKVRMIVLDPWNELEHKRRRDEAETEYIGRAIRAIKRFATRHDVAFWIVAHPAKPPHGQRGTPGLYEISGSAHWANKPDYGLTYHRPKFDENLAHIVVNKVRDGMPGRRGKAEVTFDFRTSTFRAVLPGAPA
ncbi:bifunctional DNA primase/helicase [Erythrobacteraceae bacterium CFH 75059]|uniref:AAA family ATPase n=1 Tax=Qipengyuania thermophila TaxID=2509361 RepID=UPI00101F2463|nr:AAA family ATPase [Qipengyuania thermophila]TCD00715.1 bifunctional DNA primase/helicase [Erythrobacteraceae bacterium CFH 75059]